MIDGSIDWLINGLMDDSIDRFMDRSMYVYFRQAISLYFRTQNCRLNHLPRFLELLMSLQVLHRNCSCFLKMTKGKSKLKEVLEGKAKSRVEQLLCPLMEELIVTGVPPSAIQHQVLHDIKYYNMLKLRRNDSWLWP